MMEPGQVLNLPEAAEYLRVVEEDVLRLVGVQGLPGRNIGNGWRFLKAALQDWLSTGPTKKGLLSHSARLKTIRLRRQCSRKFTNAVDDQKPREANVYSVRGPILRALVQQSGWDGLPSPSVRGLVSVVAGVGTPNQSKTKPQTLPFSIVWGGKNEAGSQAQYKEAV